MSWTRRTFPLAAVVLLLAASVPVSAAESQSILPHGAVDITGSARGARLIEQAAARFHGYGLERVQLRAIEDGMGITIAPVGTTFRSRSVTRGDGQAAIELEPMTAAAPFAKPSAQAGAVVALTQSWTMVANNCFARINDTWSWMDHCYKVFRLDNDGNGSFDFYSLQHFATMAPNSPWVLNWGQLKANWLSGTPAQTWVDWSPRGSWSGSSCGQISVGVTVEGVGLSLSADRCPNHWNMTKDNPAVNYALEWDGFGTRASRELAFEIAVQVGQGKWPQWLVPAEVHGSVL